MIKAKEKATTHTEVDKLQARIFAKEKELTRLHEQIKAAKRARSWPCAHCGAEVIESAITIVHEMGTTYECGEGYTGYVKDRFWVCSACTRWTSGDGIEYPAGKLEWDDDRRLLPDSPLGRMLEPELKRQRDEMATRRRERELERARETLWKMAKAARKLRGEL